MPCQDGVVIAWWRCWLLWGIGPVYLIAIRVVRAVGLMRVKVARAVRPADADVCPIPGSGDITCTRLVQRSPAKLPPQRDDGRRFHLQKAGVHDPIDIQIGATIYDVSSQKVRSS